MTQTVPPVPAWLRATPGEHRLPSVLAVCLVVAMQLLLPDQFSLHPRYLLPGVEAVLLLGLVVENPVRLTRQHTFTRTLSLALVATVSVGNGVSAGLLADRLVTERAGTDAVFLLASGAAVYTTNVVAFALWFWELDRGGPFARAAGLRRHPDFLFPQLGDPSLAGPDWEPLFLDYLYVAYTNATAFSPTDVSPLSRWAKMLMLVQSTVALVTVALVVARAVNTLR